MTNHRPNNRNLSLRGKNNRKPIIPQPLKTINTNTAGIDIGSSEIYVAVPPDRDVQSVRIFASFTRDLHELTQWLLHCFITSVAMESTGVYWIPLYDILQHAGIEVCLVNARYVKNVPGKKTDVLDCQWIQQLHSYGLLANSFRPEENIRRLRTISRQRDMLLKYRSAHVQHIQKALHQMNIQLDNVISDITGVTGFAIVRAIIAGQHDPLILAQYRDGHCRCSQEDIVKSLEGSYIDEHLFELTQAVELYDFYSKQISECDLRLSELYKQTQPSAYASKPLPQIGKSKKRTPRNIPFDLRSCLYRLAGVDLTQVDGLSAVSVQMILTETGVDMSKWPSCKHFTSWLSLCPNNKITGGKIISTASKKTTNRAAQAFRLAARSLYHSKSALGSCYRRLQAQHGPQLAIKATAHKLARIVYAMLKDHTDYRDLGELHYEQLFKERTLKRLKRKAADLGFQLVPANTPAPATS
jgi:transposase